MTRKKNITPRTCVYCGQPNATEGEHVIPKLLFEEKKLDPQMIKVPSCHACNQAKQRDDEFVRDMLALDSRLQRHPLASLIRTEKVMKAVGTNRSEFARYAIEKAKPILMRRPNGVVLPNFMIPLEDARTKRILERFVRGLYHHERNRQKIIPMDYDFIVAQRMGEEIQQSVAIFQQLGYSRMRQVGNSSTPGNVVFEYIYLRTLQDEFFTFWLLCFYETVFYFVVTLPQGVDFREYFERLRSAPPSRQAAHS